MGVGWLSVHYINKYCIATFCISIYLFHLLITTGIYGTSWLIGIKFGISTWRKILVFI